MDLFVGWFLGGGLGGVGFSGGLLGFFGCYLVLFFLKFFLWS